MDFDFGFDFDLDGFLSLEGFFLGVGGADLAEEGLAEPGLAERWSSAKQRLSQIEFHIISVHIKHMVISHVVIYVTCPSITRWEVPTGILGNKTSSDGQITQIWQDKPR